MKIPAPWFLAVALVVVGASAPAQSTTTPIPVRVIQGKLVVSCDISTKFRRLPVNLFVDYDRKCGLQLHNKAADGLRCETQSGKTYPITVHFGDFKLSVERREHGDEDFYDDFTKYHSVELGEKGTVGTIGAEVLAQYFVAFDLANGLIELGPPRAEDPSARDAVEGAVTLPITEVNGGAWLPVRYSNGSPAALALGGSRYDTLVSYDVCDQFDAPAGNVSGVDLGGLELSRLVAFRPDDVRLVHPDGVFGVLGLNLLERLRVEVDRVNRVARIYQTAPAEYPESDFAFFEAMIEEEAEPLADYLEKYPNERLSREAADLLLEYRLSEAAEPASCESAIRCIYATYPEDLRATAMSDLMKELVEAEHPEVAVFAGKLGVEAGRKDRYPNAVHELHSKLGSLLLDRDGREAWKHLLAAAFGLPEDGMVNLNLGRYYERAGRTRRAFSRYVQAVIKPESGPDALAALHRLQEKMGGGERMSVERIEKLVAGKVHGFGAATTYEPTPEESTNRVVLVEFFTNANLGDGSRGAIGGALGNDGLVSHFSSDHVAFVTYHLQAPELVPMTNALAAYAQETARAQPTMHVINGRRRTPGAGRWRDKEAIYNRARAAVRAEKQRPSAFDIDLQAQVEDGVLTGHVVVTGPKEDVAVQLLLVERGVLFPGRSEVVIHRNVARAALTQRPMGTWYAPENGSMRIPFEKALADVATANGAYLDKLVGEGRGTVMKMSMDIDPDQVSVVAVVRNVFTNEVFQAAQVRATAKPERD